MEDRLTFAGLTERKTLPPAYSEMAERHGADHIGSLAEALTFLETQYPAAWRDLYYEEPTPDDYPMEDDYYPVENYRAVVNPRWESNTVDELPGDKRDAVWYIPTTKYTLVEHHDALEPLKEAIGRVGGNTVFGTLRTRRHGGEVHMDVFFEGTDVGGTGDDEITLGISTGNDYMQNVSMYVDIVAFLSPSGTDGGRVMRYLVDRESRKHTGTAREDVVTFYENGVRRLDEATGKIREVVSRAMHHEVPVSEMPVSMPSFYQHLGLPDRAPSEVATPAGNRARAITPTEMEPTAWHLYKSAMWAMERNYEARDTTAFKRHMNTVNTLLFNPSLAEKRVLASVEEDLVEAKSDDDHEITEFVDDADKGVDEELEAVRTRARSVSEGVETFENVRERIESLLTDEGTEERVPDTDASDDADSGDEEMERAMTDGGTTLDEW